MHVATIAVLLGLAVTLTGCLLGPLVSDTPGSSANITTKGQGVPSISTKSELVNQIALNDGLDDRVLRPIGVGPEDPGVIPRQVGNNGDLRYWSFGTANILPGTMYQIVKRQGDGFVEVEGHPPVVNALPGDPGYNPLHAVVQVVVTDAFNSDPFSDQQHRLPSSEAIDDAVALGLVEELQIETNTFVNMPIVPPNTLIQVGATRAEAIGPKEVYVGGYSVGAFRFGGEHGTQPLSFVLPTRDVSFVRKLRGIDYDLANPIFQGATGSGPGPGVASYSALSRVIEVDLADENPVNGDQDLFLRSPTGELVSTTNRVQRHELTPTLLVLQLQLSGTL
jgi:hypothetical protein